MKRRPDIVTDHAVLRYLERVYGVDIAGLRRRLEKITAEGRAQNASAVMSDGVRYAISKSGRIITVHGVGGTMAKRGLRLRARRK